MPAVAEHLPSGAAAQDLHADEPNKVIVEVRESISDDLWKAVLHDQLDIAIVSATGLETSRHFRSEALFSEPIWLFGPRAQRGRLKNSSLENVPLILTHSNNAARDSVERDVRRSGYELRVVAETDSPRLIVELIKAGVGYTIAPYLTFIEHLRTRRLSGRPVKRLKVERTLIRRNDRSVSKAMRVFASLLRPEIETACREIARTGG